MTSDSKRTRWLVLGAVCGLGVSAVMTQLALMREMLSTFSGNELSLGLILGCWLLLTALGTWLGGTTERLKDPWRAMFWAQVLVALLPVAQVVLVRCLRNVVFLRGAALGATDLVGSTLIILLPFCLASGYLLTLACSVLASESLVEEWVERATSPLSAATCRQSPWRAGSPPQQADGLFHPGDISRTGSQAGSGRDAHGIGSVYVADSVGSILGGLFFSFVLIRWFDHCALLCFPALLNLAMAGALAWRVGRKALWGTALCLAVGVLALLGFWDLDALSTARQFPGQEIVFRGHSPYGKLIVTHAAGQYNFLENGLPVISTHNIEAVEETVHYAMAQRPDAAQVLLVSGGISGTAKEILRYGVREVAYVELDPLILEAGRKFLPDSLADSRIKVVNTDGRWFIKQTDQRFDVVIVAVPDPSTSRINRFYTLEFFHEVKRVLSAGGVLGLALGHYENYVSPELARLLASCHQTLKRSFSNVLAIPGGRVFFLASDGPLHDDIAARLEEAGVTTQLVNRHYLAAMVRPDRMADIRRATSEPAAINRDFSPVLYYYHWRHWLSQFNTRLGWFPGILLVLLAVGLAGALLRNKGRHQNSLATQSPITNHQSPITSHQSPITSHQSPMSPRLEVLARTESEGRAGQASGPHAVPLVLFASGFAAMALEIVLLLGFQILFGSVYYQVGWIVTVFMLGLAVGGWLTNRRLSPSPESVRTRQKHFLTGRSRREEALTDLGFWILGYGSGRQSLLRSAATPEAGSKALAALAFAIAALACLLPLVLAALNLPASTLPPVLGKAMFLLLTFILAGLAGAQFPLASQIERRRQAVTAARLYTADLVGASLGAFLAGALLIPLIGVTGVCLLAGGLNVIGGAAVLRRKFGA